MEPLRLSNTGNMVMMPAILGMLVEMPTKRLPALRKRWDKTVDILTEHYHYVDGLIPWVKDKWPEGEDNSTALHALYLASRCFAPFASHSRDGVAYEPGPLGPKEAIEYLRRPTVQQELLLAREKFLSVSSPEPRRPRQLPPDVHPTVRAAAAFIDKNPGAVGKQIAEAVGVKPNTFYKEHAPKLKDFGYWNLGGDGYHPPRADSITTP